MFRGGLCGFIIRASFLYFFAGAPGSGAARRARGLDRRGPLQDGDALIVCRHVGRECGVARLRREVPVRERHVGHRLAGAVFVHGLEPLRQRLALHGQPDLPLHTHVAKREVVAGGFAHVLRAGVTTRRRVGQQRFCRVAVEEIGQWQRHVISLGKRVEGAVDGLWHRCLREHLVLLDGDRQLLAVVPGLEPLAAGQLRVKTIGTPQGVDAGQRHAILRARATHHVAQFGRRHRQLGCRSKPLAHLLNELPAAGQSLGIGGRAPCARTRRR